MVMRLLVRHASTLGLGSAVVVGAGLIAVLGYQVNVLFERSTEYRHMLTFPHEGQWVPVERVPTTVGDSATIGEAGQGGAQVVMVFGTSCEYSLRSLPHWQRLADSLATSRFAGVEVLWVSVSPIDSTAQYARARGLPDRVAVIDEKRLAHIYKLLATPVTTVLDSRGRVAYARVGELTGAAVDSIAAAARAVLLEGEAEFDNEGARNGSAELSPSPGRKQ